MLDEEFCKQRLCILGYEILKLNKTLNVKSKNMGLLIPTGSYLFCLWLAGLMRKCKAIVSSCVLLELVFRSASFLYRFPNKFAD